MKRDTRPQKGGCALGKYVRFCAVCKICFAGDKQASTCADCAHRDAGETDAIINQWAADVERLERRVAEVERVGTNLWRVAGGFRIDELYDHNMDEIPIEEADPECVVYEYDHGDGIQVKHVIELNKALDAWNEVKP